MRSRQVSRQADTHENRYFVIPLLVGINLALKEREWVKVGYARVRGRGGEW